MQVVHPMQECPTEFLETFRTILEKCDWSSEFSIFLCHEIEDESHSLTENMVDWVRDQLAREYTFTNWLIRHKGFHEETQAHFVNQCRKAWLEWLVSPEGHYTST